MADFNGRALDCDDCEGERGERGKRGKRGHRGHQGHDGQDGATGATGATGPTGPTVLSGNNFVFRPGEPNPGGNVFADWATLCAALLTVEGYKTLQFDNSIVSPCVIPPGLWDMTDVEWTGLTSAVLGAPNPVIIDVVEGAQFVALLTIGGQIVINNRATVTPPNVIASATTVEFGFGPAGDNPNLVNIGTAPFWDASSMPNNNALIIRHSGGITGSNPAIQLGAGSGTRFVDGMGLVALTAANMVVGSNPAAVVSVIYGGPSSSFCQQPNFLGVITQGVGSWVRHTLRPAPPAPPSTVPLTPPNLLMNATHLLNPGIVADLAQPLPLIRLAVPATGANQGVPGSLLSTGIWATFVNTINPTTPGAKNVVLTAAAGETINNGALAAVIVPPGGAVTLLSNGVSTWWVTSSYP